MKRFKNVKTGNIVRAKNATAEKLMESSKQYVAVSEKKAKGKDDTNAESGEEGRPWPTHTPTST